MAVKCGCRACYKREQLEEVQEFIDVTSEFARIMHHSFKPDEEWNLKLLASRLAGTVTIGDLSGEGARLRQAWMSWWEAHGGVS